MSWPYLNLVSAILGHTAALRHAKSPWSLHLEKPCAKIVDSRFQKTIAVDDPRAEKGTKAVRLLFVMASLVVLGGCSKPEPPKVELPQVPSLPPPAKVAEEDWPDKAKVLEWFNENIGEPESVSIITHQMNPARNGEMQSHRVKYRCRNIYGALAVEERTFIVYPNGMMTVTPPRTP